MRWQVRSLARRLRALGVGGLALGLSVLPAQAIRPHQSDDFEDGTTQGWTSGAANPTPPVAIAGGGPEGAEDGYLRLQSSGGAGPGGNLIAFHTGAWSGSYTRARVSALDLWLRNEGAAPLVVRLLLEGPGGGFFTDDAVALAPGEPWTAVRLRVGAEHLVGSGDPATTLEDVTKLRILHAPSPEGAEPVAGVLGIDDVTAVLAGPCEDTGLGGSALGLCRAACEALACESSAASSTCERLALRFEDQTGETLPCFSPLPDPCPCFGREDVAGLLAALSDGDVYEGLACTDTRILAKPTTFVSAVRRDGAPCATATPECSALSVEFTEDDVCQLHAPAPAPPIVVQGLLEEEREACRLHIVEAAADAGLPCN